MTSYTIAKGSDPAQFTGLHTATICQCRALKVQGAEGVQVLFPFVDEIWRNHDDDRPLTAMNANAIGDRQSNKGLPHSYFVRKHHPGLAAESRQDFNRFRALAPLLAQRYSLVWLLAEYQIVRQGRIRVHGCNRLCTLDQNCWTSRGSPGTACTFALMVSDSC